MEILFSELVRTMHRGTLISGEKLQSASVDTEICKAIGYFGCSEVFFFCTESGCVNA